MKKLEWFDDVWIKLVDIEAGVLWSEKKNENEEELYVCGWFKHKISLILRMNAGTYGSVKWKK